MSLQEKRCHQEKQGAGCVTEINTNECCVCLELYSEDVSGAEWIECACGRWLHENCGEECIVDADGILPCMPVAITLLPTHCSPF